MIIVEEHFKHLGTDCIVTFNTELAFRCGYVSLHPKSKYNKTAEYDIANEINIYGGCTFKGELNHVFTGPTQTVFLGFDCGHCFDGRDIATLKELNKWDCLPQWIKNYFESSTANPKSKQFVIDECKSIAEQLQDHEKELFWH